MQKNRIEKLLQSCGFKLSTFLTDIFGVSGRALLELLVKNGSISPIDVERELRGRAKLKKDEMKFALNGKLNAHQRNLLSMQLSFLDEMFAHLEEIKKSIASSSVCFNEQIQLLTTIPGIALTAARAIIGEIGVDMSKNFGNTYLKGLICACAWCMVRSRNTYLSKFYWKIKQRCGAKKAIIAVARKMLVIIYNMLKNNETYSEDKFERAKQKQSELRIKKILLEAKKLGLIISESPVA